MPHPHEQKLHEVVNSLTFASFNLLCGGPHRRQIEKAIERKSNATAHGGSYPLSAVDSCWAVYRRMIFHLTLGLTLDSLIASPIHRYRVRPPCLRRSETTSAVPLRLKTRSIHWVAPILCVMLVGV